MRRAIVLIALGAVLLIGAAAGFVIVPEHKPQHGEAVVPGWGGTGVYFHTGWSQTVYDAARIATWALLIVGTLLVVVVLINYARRPHRRGTASDTAQLPRVGGEGVR
jgi:hypothetical protein